MNQLVTRAIILGRTDFGEADRILTLLTPEQGKLRLVARGVRRVKSKLAGGIELFSVSTITYMRGRGELGTLVSTRLDRYYGHIVTDLERTMLGYELIKQLNKRTEDEAEGEYFMLLHHSFEVLDKPVVPLSIIRLWFMAQLLRFGGHTPNLYTDVAGQKLDVATAYRFDLEDMAFRPAETGQFGPDHIKFLRLVFSQHGPKALASVRRSEHYVRVWTPIVQAMTNRYL